MLYTDRLFQTDNHLLGKVSRDLPVPGSFQITERNVLAGIWGLEVWAGWVIRFYKPWELKIPWHVPVCLSKLCFMLSNTLLLQYPTPACVLILSAAAKGHELFSIQRIFVLQTGDWSLFFLSFFPPFGKAEPGLRHEAACSFRSLLTV